MRFLTSLLLVTVLAGLGISLASATPASCRISSVTSCRKAITSTKTRTLSLTNWCSSVLGCVKSTTTITGDAVTITPTKIIWESYTFDFLAAEETTTETFTYTESIYTAISTVTLTPTFTVERFVVTTVKPRARRWDEAVHARDLLKRERTTSICPSAVQKQACSCILTGCAPPITKDARETIKSWVTETSYAIFDNPVTYTNIEWVPIYTTETESDTETTTSAVISTHTTTIKCTPSSANPSFYLQATDVPPVNGQYWWVAPTHPRLLHFSIEAAFTPDILEASVFSLDSAKRLISAHKNGTMYANVDPYNKFQIVHHMPREEIRLRHYDYLRCEIRPASGKYPGNYGELYCLADGWWHREVWNYCPIYDEWFNSPLLLANEWSETTPECFPIMFLVKPVCEEG